MAFPTLKKGESMSTVDTAPKTRLQQAYERAASFSKQFREGLKPWHMLAKETRAIHNLIAQFESIPRNVSTLIAQTKITSVFSVPFSLFDAKTHFQNAFLTPGKKFTEKFIAFIKFHICLDKATDGTASGLQMLQKLNLIGRGAVAWIPFFKMVDWVFQTINLGFTAHGTHKMRLLDREIRDLTKSIEGKTTAEKVDLLKAAFTREENESGTPSIPKLFSRDVADVQKALKIDNEVLFEGESEKVELKRRILKVAKELHRETPRNQDRAVKHAEEILKGLKSRASLCLGLSALDLANRCVIMVAAAFVTFPQFIFPLAVPVLFPVGFSIFIATGVISIGAWGAEKFLITKDPFNKGAKMPVQEMASQLHEKLIKTKNSVVFRIQATFAMQQTVEQSA